MSILNQIKPDFWRDKEISTGPYRRMFNFRRIWKMAVLLTSLVTLLPLIVITSIDYNFTQKSIESENLLRTLRIGSNARRSISFFLSERLSALSFVVRDNSVEELYQPEKLQSILLNLRESFDGFVDLGMVDSAGIQRNYFGPYNLEGKDYSTQDWFKEIPNKRFSISEVFLGFRKVPHLIIGVRHTLPDGSFFVLRSAIDTKRFNELLSGFELGGKGDSFLINREGIIQTPTLYHGQVFDRMVYAVPKYSEYTEIREETNATGESVIICSAYIPDSPYILVIIKNKNELMKPWRETRVILIGFLVVSISVILLVILGVSTYMVNNMYLVDQRRLIALHEVEYTNKLASIGRLAAGVAHEINNPLAIINEKAGLIKDIFSLKENYAGDSKLVGLVDSVLSSVERCGTITKRLLSFARHIDSAIETIQIGEVIKEVLGFLHKEAEYRNITIKIDFAENIPTFQSDRGKLQQIFLNIINNAFAAMSVGGHLEVSVRYVEAEGIKAKIIDNGCGMSEAELGKIYEPFYSTKTKAGGTGLGLSITYGLVQELGGRIDVASRVGEGTSFTVTLPLEAPQKTKER
ncbi:MAG: two-component sensor histidine kinase [Desulfobacterales bacterium GWB2_56_26]|nr:MAG: two-component sensor histidine kinase [Desulfobacterales bacterium GWB2_56_26]